MAGGWRPYPTAKKLGVCGRGPKRLTRGVGKRSVRRASRKVIVPFSARVLEAIYFIPPFASLPLALTLSMASSFHSSSVYSWFSFRRPTETDEEKRTKRRILPLGKFQTMRGKNIDCDPRVKWAYGALMADFRTLRVPSTAGRMISVRSG